MYNVYMYIAYDKKRESKRMSVCVCVHEKRVSEGKNNRLIKDKKKK